MNELDLLYPQSCPFCKIASAYPAPSLASSSLSTMASSDTSPLLSCIPDAQDADPDRTSPSSFVVLAAPDVLAFLDILPMTKGHLLVASRKHRRMVGDLERSEGAEIGFWLPLLSRTVCRVAGVEDWNIVQNNGVRAAQVVPHVHFHIIPRPASMPEVKNKSWTMFGRGQRDELDDEDGERIAAEMRRVLREEVERAGRTSGKEKL